MSNTFSKLTIKGQSYTIDDTTKMVLPENTGKENQILTRTATGYAWRNVPVSSVNGKSGIVNINASDAGAEPSGAILSHNTDSSAHQDIRDEFNNYVTQDQLQAVSKGGNHIGSIFTHPSAKPPPGAFLLNGQTIYNCRETYKEFWAWLQEEIGEMVDVPLYKPWTQPALTENGTMGGDSYACACSGGSYLEYQAHRSFDGSRSNNTYCIQTVANNDLTAERTLTFYSPDKLKISQVELIVNNVQNYRMIDFEIQASSDGISWTTIYSGSIKDTDYYNSIFCLIPEEKQAGNNEGWSYIRLNCIKTLDNNVQIYTAFPKVFITAQQYYRTAKVSNGYTRAIDAQYYEDTVAQYGICGAFAVTENDVRLPLYNNAFLQAGDSSNIGKEVEAGLPNITGSLNALSGYYGTTSTSGSFTAIRDGSTGVSHNNAAHWSPTYFNFDASLSNDVYGKSDTVQPLSIRVSYCIQVFNAATELSTQESAQLASQMQMKAQTDLANVTEPVQAFKDMAISWGMPDYTAGVDITSSLTAANSEYTIPYDCCIIIAVFASGNAYLFSKSGCLSNDFTNAPYRLISCDTVYGSNDAQSGIIYCQKGMKIYSDAAGPMTNACLTMYPLKGADK